MPISKIDVPFISPIKFYPVVAAGYPGPGIHFDSDFYYNQIKSWETKACYHQKREATDPLTIQVAATSMPGNLVVYNSYGVLQPFATAAFTLKAPGGSLGYNIYEANVTFDTYGLIEGIYYLYSKTTLLGTDYAILSEPISLKAKWPDTLLFTYRNTLNDFGVIFTTGIEFNFRCEAGIMDFQPESEVAAYIDQVRNVEILSGVPYRVFKLYIGRAPGVAPYIADILNRIFCCDHVNISRDGTNQKQYVKPASSKWEPSRQKGWPLHGWATDILEAKNLSGFQINTIIDPENIKMVNSYNIETNFFGLAQDALITEIEIIN